MKTSDPVWNTCLGNCVNCEVRDQCNEELVALAESTYEEAIKS